MRCQPLYCLVAFCVLASGQTPAPAEPKPAQKQGGSESSAVYVRRFTGGIHYSYTPLLPLQKGSVNQTLTVIPGHMEGTSNPQSLKSGYGLNFQAALSEHFAVYLAVTYRKAAYSASTNYLLGVDNPNTFIDDRNSWVVTEDTRARFFEVPLLVRYYDKGRHRPGPRWFLEAGPSVRAVRRVRTSRIIADPVNNVTTDSTPYAPRHKNLPGVTAGAGIQLIDPIGIRVVPEFRYTHWLGSTFSAAPTRTSRSQLEVMISLTF